MSRTRLAKEFRPLLLPWCVAAAAACLLPLFALLDDRSGIGVAQFFSTLSFLAFFGSITVLAGISFGAEFQERTFGLLISQPVERARLWREKLLTLVLGVATVSIILWGTHT